MTHASDIPTGFGSPYEMARSLATYIDCPKEIIRRVRTQFDSVPPPHRISELIASHCRPIVSDAEPVCLGDGYYPGQEREKLEQANHDFLWRLDLERLASQRRRELALEAAQ